MITVARAEAIIADHIPPPVMVMRRLADALGYTLAQQVAAERDHPPFDRITHDGIAIDHAAFAQGLRRFPVEAYAAAGQARATLRNARHCVEVATGAPLPEGCDTVIPYEALALKDRTAEIIGPAIPGQSIHRQGSDATKGQLLLDAGRKIGIHETAILAANGVAQVKVVARPSIGVLATGDELVAVDGAIELHQIRRSNDITLQAALAVNGFPDAQTGWVRDDKEALSAQLQAWLASKDVILITGGVSRGSYDYVPQVLETLGVSARFHHVAQRPGKPLWFGVSSNGKLVFGLPGNPASSLTCLHRYVIPALQRMSGIAVKPVPTLQLAAPATAHDTLTLFTPVRGAVTVATHGSGDFTGLLDSDGFVELPPRAGGYAAGEEVAFFPWVLS